MSMHLDLTHLGRRGHEHVDRTYEPAAFKASDADAEEYRVAGPVHLVMDVHRESADAFKVSGRVTTRLELECGRCLEPFEMGLDQDLELFFLPHVADQVEEEDEVELSDHDMVVAYYRDNRLDLGEAVREQIVLGVPLKGLCREDCRGLCPGCGVNHNTADCACTFEEPEDPRLAPLRKLFEKH